jgi:hypothetical protein
MNFLKDVQQQQVLSKSLVKTMSENLINEANEGNIDVLSALAHLEFMSQVIDAAKDELRKQAVDEIEKYGMEAKSGVVKYGVTFKQKEAGVRYNFDNTDSWKALKSKEDEQAAIRKDLEDQLKSLKQKITVLDEETGELTDLYPPVKTSKTTIEITLAK